jgi:hypothetical protein
MGGKGEDEQERDGGKDERGRRQSMQMHRIDAKTRKKMGCAM